MQYEWDNRKNTRNIEKHGIGFDLVYHAQWTSALVAPDTRKDYGEKRFQAYVIIKGRLHVVVYVDRKTVRRIISLRKASPKERKQYDQAY